jgi:hypothetical protein
LLVGLPLGLAILALIHFGPMRDTEARRYVSHPVEGVEVVMFCCALGALGAKLCQNLSERRTLSVNVLPDWDGRSVPVTEASTLLAHVNRFAPRQQETFLLRRVANVLHFLCSRGSAAELDDHLRCLADNDSVALENNNALVRFITWAIPILGFLGTVLGITGAISGVTPEVLEHSLSKVTDGLALAFDATALALGLTMVTMFINYLVDRAEQSTLEQIDRYAERQLAHRFERAGAGETAVAHVVRQNMQALLQTNEQLVRRQAEVWAEALAEVDRRRGAEGEAHEERFTQALEAALERTLQSHAERLAALEKQSAEQTAGVVKQIATLAAAIRETGTEQREALRVLNERVVAQAKAVAHLQEGEKQLRRLQELLNQNLHALASAGTFEQALHSLTAAIHLITARAGGASVPRMAA